MLHWIYYGNTFVKCINKSRANIILFNTRKKTVQSKVIFVWEEKQKSRMHHTDEIEGHRYEVANELKGEHIHVVNDFEQTQHNIQKHTQYLVEEEKGI